MKRDYNEKLNPIHAIEQITDLLSSCKYNSEDIPKLKQFTTFLCDYLDINEWQSKFLSVLISEGYNSGVSTSTIAIRLDCSPLRMIQHKEDIQELIRRKYIRYSDNKDEYFVQEKFMDSLAKEIEYVPFEFKENMSFEEFFEAVVKVINDNIDDLNSLEYFFADFKELCQKNMQIQFAKEIMDVINAKEIKRYEILVLILTCNKLVSRRTYLSMDVIDDIELEDNTSYRIFKKDLENSNTELQRRGWIEFGEDDGYIDTSYIMLTEIGADRFLPGFGNQILEGRVTGFEPKHHEDITEKALFYNEREQAEVAQLTDLLGEDNFKGICQRLKENGLRCGFTALFYGAPGTGKTETALQLARLTGRNVINAEVSELRSKWVGDSEKNIKQLFKFYKREVKRSAIAPILLFNEADSIIGNRLTGTLHGADRAENSVQNIILEEMEKLEGIMIATSNLSANIDKAFDRRFLYKIKFDRPKADTRTKIWKSMIPQLDDEMAKKLADEFNLSGGQMENVTRRNLINHILYNTGLTNYEKLLEYCKAEQEDTHKTFTIKGF